MDCGGTTVMLHRRREEVRGSVEVSHISSVAFYSPQHRNSPCLTRPLARFRITERSEIEQLTKTENRKYRTIQIIFHLIRLNVRISISISPLLSLQGRITLQLCLPSVTRRSSQPNLRFQVPLPTLPLPTNTQINPQSIQSNLL